MTTFREDGQLIGKYLREKYSDKIDPTLTDDQIGEHVFNSDAKGELYNFFMLYENAKIYYGIL